ncbi:MAG: phosphatidylcholine/phosphatidylserine synthase, partial [Phycisphaerae bacterium]
TGATLANMLCGVLAILCCLFTIRGSFAGDRYQITTPTIIDFFPSYIAVGGYLIMLAMVFDALDGRLARLTRRTSEFGSQLDSIADVVSFGVAPALLFVTILMRPFEETLVTTRVQWQLGLAAALTYASCAAVRLARFNAENTRGESAQRQFSGLPTPGAAAAFVGFILLYETMLRGGQVSKPGFLMAACIWIMAVSAVGLGYLMLSRLDYAHVFNLYVRSRRPPSHLIAIIMAVFVLLYVYPSATVFVVSWLYVLSGFLASYIFKPKPVTHVEPVSEVQHESNY